MHFFLFYFQAWCRRHIADGYLDQPSVNGPNTMPAGVRKGGADRGRKDEKKDEIMCFDQSQEVGVISVTCQIHGLRVYFYSYNSISVYCFFGNFVCKLWRNFGKVWINVHPRGVADPAACCIVSFIPESF